MQLMTEVVGLAGNEGMFVTQQVCVVVIRNIHSSETPSQNVSQIPRSRLQLDLERTGQSCTIRVLIAGALRSRNFTQKLGK